MAAIELPIKLQGMHGSPYTRKMLALLRYRRLPYRFIVNFPQNPNLPGNGPERASLPIPKVPLLPTFYFKQAFHINLSVLIRHGKPLRY